jgi:hypothetical protein
MAPGNWSDYCNQPIPEYEIRLCGIEGGIEIMKFAGAFLTVFLVLNAVSAEAQNGRGVGNGGQNRCACCPRLDTSYPVQEISADEAAMLLFSREEEKLARDVYQALAEKWPLRIFRNIGAAENRHFDAIGSMIARYELSDPALADAGAFSDPELQTMYDELVTRGLRSLRDAFEVGVDIEEKDIEDLDEAMSATDNKDILAVYENLLGGSLNHLSAFKRQLVSNGGIQRGARSSTE